MNASSSALIGGSLSFDGSDRRPQREHAGCGVERTLNSAACMVELDDGQKREHAEADSEGQPAGPAATR